MKVLNYLNILKLLIYFGCTFSFAQSPPQLLVPFSDEVTNKQSITFSWNNNPIENENYQFQLATDSTFNVILHDSLSNSHLITINGFGPSDYVYYWRVRKINPLSQWSNVRGLIYFNPQNISGLTLWLDPTTGVVLNSGNVQQINDQSLFGNNAIQVNSAQRPVFVIADSLINNKPSIKFDGSNDFLDIADNTSLDYSTEFTTFTLIKPRLVASNKTILAKWDYPTQGSWVIQTDFSFADELMFAPCFTITDPGNQKYYTNNADLIAQQPSLVTMKYEGGAAQKVKLYKNSIQLQTTIFGSSIPDILPNSTASLKVGKYGGVATRYFDGDITEVLIYNSALNNDSRGKVESYFRYKYSPPVNLGPDTVIATNFNCGNLQLKAAFKYSSYLWSTGSTASRITIQEPGNYWVTVTDFMGNISTDSIVVYPPFSYNYPSENFICVEQTEIWTPNFPSTDFTFLWQDGSTSGSMPLLSTGMYHVKITDGLGCFVLSDTLNITIDNYSDIAFLGNDTTLCVGNSIGLQNGAIQTTNYEWLDGSSNATFLIDSLGSYSVSLISTNNNGCISHDTIAIIVAGIAPNAVININSATCSNSIIDLSEQSTVISPYSIVSVHWLFSNGFSSSSSQIQLPLMNQGYISGEIVINADNGCASKDTFTIHIFDPPNLSINNTNFCSNDSINFFAQNTIGNSLLGFQWNFGDNTSSLSGSPSHLYGNYGVYNVSLQAQDINGCRDTVMQEVYIQPAPTAAFSFNNTCEETEVNFVNNSNISDTFSITTNAWSYGDGTQAINPSFQKIYADADTFDVELIVTANNGCQDTSIQSIIIYPRPTLDWQVGPTCKNTWTTIESQSYVPIGNIVQTDWLVNLQYPLEGTISAYQFVTTGVQYLNLTSTTDNGCQRDTLIIVNVQPEINATYTVTPSNVVAGISPVFSSTSIGADQYEWIFGFGNTELTVSDEPVVAPPYPTSSIGDTVLTLLVIENQVGCKDSAYRYLKINEPRIDLAVNQLFAEEINGYLKIGVELKNLGFIEITQTDLILKMLNSTPILETETAPLAPGESRIYLFNANPSSFISTQDNESSFLCVEAKSFNDFALIETELNNNYTCLNLEGGSLLLMPIYPNPTFGDITYSFMSASESEIKCTLTDETGRTILETSESHSAGLHSQTLPMRNLSAGVYYFQITDGTRTKTVKILKN
jgi:hypothetical protein